MDKRIEKRHKRAVTRAKQRVKGSSEPDLRTPEQIKAAREASRPAASGHPATAGSVAPSSRGNRPRTSGSGAKTDA